MDVFEAAQVAGATEDDLLRCLRTVCARLREMNEQRALRTATEVLTEHGCQLDLRLTIGVDEWDDGYYFANIETAQDATGRTVLLPLGVIEALDQALQEALTELVYASGPIGRSARLAIDLAGNTVTY